MQDASTPRQRFWRISREFETSRLEKGLLAAAYERAVPTVSGRMRRRPTNPLATARANPMECETDFQPSLATERHAG
jgi:hypothetical protein